MKNCPVVSAWRYPPLHSSTTLLRSMLPLLLLPQLLPFPRLNPPSKKSCLPSHTHTFPGPSARWAELKFPAEQTRILSSFYKALLIPQLGKCVLWGSNRFALFFRHICLFVQKMTHLISSLWIDAFSLLDNLVLMQKKVDKRKHFWQMRKVQQRRENLSWQLHV